MVLRRSSRSPGRSGADGTQARSGKVSRAADDPGAGLDSEAAVRTWSTRSWTRSPGT